MVSARPSCVPQLVVGMLDDMVRFSSRDAALLRVFFVVLRRLAVLRLSRPRPQGTLVLDRSQGGCTFGFVSVRPTVSAVFVIRQYFREQL